MTCFIAYPLVCRSYAKCHGWQETLAHFFIKSRRSTSIQSFDNITSPIVLNDTVSANTKEQSINFSREGSNDPHIDNDNISISLISSQMYETSSNLEDLAQDKVVQKIDLSPIINATTDTDLTQVVSSPGPSLTPNSTVQSLSLLIDNKDATPEFLQRGNEDFQQTINEPVTDLLRSSSPSGEDLNSELKRDSSNIDLSSTASNYDLSSELTRTTTSTSMKNHYSDEENNEQSGRRGPEARKILGWPFSCLL